LKRDGNEMDFRASFNLFDMNKNGLIDDKELSRVFDAEMMPEYRADVEFDFLDEDRDGWVTLSEFTSGTWRALEGASAEST
jgi:Ca2+-binding EF-hand superfamily protein